MQTTITPSLFTALCLFSIAIPLLVASVALIDTELLCQTRLDVPSKIITSTIGLLLSAAGIALLFIHFSWIVGGLFGASSVYGVTFYSYRMIALLKLDTAKRMHDQPQPSKHVQSRAGESTQ